MELRRRDWKRTLVNVAIVFLLLLTIVIFAYGWHVVKLLSPEAPSFEDFCGRMYGNVEKNVYLMIERDGLVTLSEDGVETTIQTSEYKYVDGIISFEIMKDEEAQKFEFILIEGDRLFYNQENVYMELVWIKV